MRPSFEKLPRIEKHGNAKVKKKENIGKGASKPEAKREIHRESGRKGIRARFQAAAVLLRVCVVATPALRSITKSPPARAPLCFSAQLATHPPLSLSLPPSAYPPFASFGCCCPCSPLWSLCTRSAHRFSHHSGRQHSTSSRFHRSERAFGVGSSESSFAAF